MMTSQNKKQARGKFSKWLRTLTAAVTALLLISAPLVSAAAEFSAGSVSDNTYRNEFLGITCTLSDDWQFLTEKELAEGNGFEVSQWNDEYLAEVCEQRAVTLMSAENFEGEGLLFFDMNYQKLTGLTGLMQLSDGVLTEFYQGIAEAKIEDSESSGITDLRYEIITVTFLGESVPALLYEGTVSDLEYHEINFVKQAGEGLIAMILISMGEELPSEVWEKCVTAI